MDLTYLAVLGTGFVVTGASVVAILADRFQKAEASLFAFIAGVPPLLFYLMWNNHVHAPGQAFTLFAMFGSGPLFLIAFFLYGLGNQAKKLSLPACV